MFQLTVRGLVAHRRRLVSTMLAILLGVSFMAGSRILTDTMKSTLAGVFVNSERTTDVQVRGVAAFDANGQKVRADVPQSVLADVAAVPGVAAAVPRIEGFAQIVDSKGKPVGNLNNGDTPLGAAWSQDPELNPFHLTAGRAPRADDEVVIDARTAKSAHLRVGSATRVLTATAPRPVTVVGVARFGGADSMAGTSSVLFTTAAAQRYLAADGTVSAIALRAGHSVSQRELARRVQAVLPPKLEAVTGTVLADENRHRTSDDVSFLTVFMTAFAVVSLLVGAFIINNTFAIVVAQRTRELALVRALGASRKQVRRSVALEALLLGVFASAIGLVAGVGVAKGLHGLMSTFGIPLPDGPLVIRTSSLVVAFVVGVAVTLVSALLPARRAARVAPVAAMRDVAAESTRPGVKRAGTGVVLAGAGAAAVVLGVVAGQIAPVMLGALAAVLGVAALGPFLARPAMRVLGSWLPRTRGARGLLARENAARNPRRTSATAAALMIGVSLVGAMTCFAASGKWSVTTSFDKEYKGDLVIESGAYQYGGFSPDLAAALAKLPQLTGVSGKRATAASVGGKVTDLSALRTSRLADAFDVGTTAGSTDLGTDGIALERKLAAARGLTLGAPVQVRFGTGQQRTLTVKALYKHSDWVGKAFIDNDLLSQVQPKALDVSVSVKAAPGVSPAAARAAVETVTANYANATVRDRAAVRKEIVDQFNKFLGFIYAMLALAVFIALMGIANTVSLSVVERTREIGLLRAVGMSRPHVRAMVRWEAGLVGAFGAVMGLATGLFLGWSLVFAVSRQVETARFVVPWAQLAVIVAVAATCGVIAALLPARRAARLDVLQAIAST